MSSFPDRNLEFDVLVSTCFVNAKNIAFAAVLLFIERTNEAYSGLDGDNSARPHDFIHTCLPLINYNLSDLSKWYSIWSNP